MEEDYTEEEELKSALGVGEKSKNTEEDYSDWYTGEIRPEVWEGIKSRVGERLSKKQTYLNCLKDLDLNTDEGFLIYISLVNNIKKDYAEEIARGRSEPFGSYMNILSDFVLELPRAGWEIPENFERKDFYSMQSLAEIREECIRISEYIKS